MSYPSRWASGRSICRLIRTSSFHNRPHFSGGREKKKFLACKYYWNVHAEPGCQPHKQTSLIQTVGRHLGRSQRTGPVLSCLPMSPPTVQSCRRYMLDKVEKAPPCPCDNYGVSREKRERGPDLRHGSPEWLNTLKKKAHPLTRPLELVPTHAVPNSSGGSQAGSI